MIIPEGAPADKYETTFIYEKEGNRKEFTLNNYPANDTTWKFIDQKSVLVKKGYKPPIHDFSITAHERRRSDPKVLIKSRIYTVNDHQKNLKKQVRRTLEEGFELGRLLHE